MARLRARETTYGAMIFRTGESRVIHTMTKLWRARIVKAFALAGEFEEKPTPHRFRHTFVRILLEKGVPVADVAELIGDTEENGEAALCPLGSGATDAAHQHP